MRSVAFSFALMAGLAVAGCESVTGPGDADLVVELVGEPVEDADGFLIRFDVRNRGGEAAGITSVCDGALNPGVQARVDGRWESVGGGFCLSSLYMGPMVVAPGAAISGATRWEDPGRYRLRLGAARADGGGEIDIVSEGFLLVR